MELDATYHELITRLVHINARITELHEEQDSIKHQLANNLKHGDYTINGKPAFTLSVGKRFDPNLAAQIIPPQLLPLCQALVIDSTRAKAVLPPTLYEQCQKPNSKPTVRLQ